MGMMCRGNRGFAAAPQSATPAVPGAPVWGTRWPPQRIAVVATAASSSPRRCYASGLPRRRLGPLWPLGANFSATRASVWADRLSTPPPPPPPW
uniref:Uncharacterized protein n=1 Tax=Oryza punctata TaxID=4537 RepID=A0A0E0KUH9_ORYPU